MFINSRVLYAILVTFCHLYVTVPFVYTVDGSITEKVLRELRKVTDLLMINRKFPVESTMEKRLQTHVR